LRPVCNPFHKWVYGDYRKRGCAEQDTNGWESDFGWERTIGHLYLYQFNWVKTANPALSCNPRNPTAWGIVTSLFAIGRVLVLSAVIIQGQNQAYTNTTPEHTIILNRVFGRAGEDSPTPLSKFRSHMSLIVHPAPRITNAPTPKRLKYARGVVIGRLSAYEAIVIDQAIHFVTIPILRSRLEGTHCTGSTITEFR